MFNATRTRKHVHTHPHEHILNTMIHFSHSMLLFSLFNSQTGRAFASCAWPRHPSVSTQRSNPLVVGDQRIIVSSYWAYLNKTNDACYHRVLCDSAEKNR